MSDYFDPFICPQDDPDCTPVEANQNVSYYDGNVQRSTPIMKYNLWPAWSVNHYDVSGNVIAQWW